MFIRAIPIWCYFMDAVLYQALLSCGFMTFESTLLHARCWSSELYNPCPGVMEGACNLRAAARCFRPVFASIFNRPGASSSWLHRWLRLRPDAQGGEPGPLSSLILFHRFFFDLRSRTLDWRPTLPWHLSPSWVFLWEALPCRCTPRWVPVGMAWRIGCGGVGTCFEAMDLMFTCLEEKNGKDRMRTKQFLPSPVWISSHMFKRFSGKVHDCKVAGQDFSGLYTHIAGDGKKS